MKRENPLVTTLYAWNDFLWILFLSMSVAVIILTTMAIQIKTDIKTQEDRPAGDISVYVFWQDGIDLDIDTHLMGPDGEHIFYGKPIGHNWNLLRDDLGMKSDDGNRNFENAYSRGVPRGQYIVNIHAYRGTPDMFPQIVHVEVRIVSGSGGKGSATILKQDVTLYKVKEEVTAIRWAMDDHGLIASSVNHIQKSIIKQEAASQ